MQDLLTSSSRKGSAGVGSSSLGASLATGAVSSAGLAASVASLASSLGAESFLPKCLMPLMKRVDRRRLALRALVWGQGHP